jgi:hypothetical protein
VLATGLLSNICVRNPDAHPTVAGLKNKLFFAQATSCLSRLAGHQKDFFSH